LVEIGGRETLPQRPDKVTRGVRRTSLRLGVAEKHPRMLF
jgi:hypothetical protein